MDRQITLPNLVKDTLFKTLSPNNGHKIFAERALSSESDREAFDKLDHQGELAPTAYLDEQVENFKRHLSRATEGFDQREMQKNFIRAYTGKRAAAGFDQLGSQAEDKLTHLVRQVNDSFGQAVKSVADYLETYRKDAVNAMLHCSR